MDIGGIPSVVQIYIGRDSRDGAYHGEESDEDRIVTNHDLDNLSSCMRCYKSRLSVGLFLWKVA